MRSRINLNQQPKEGVIVHTEPPFVRPAVLRLINLSSGHPQDPDEFRVVRELAAPSVAQETIAILGDTYRRPYNPNTGLPEEGRLDAIVPTFDGDTVLPTGLTLGKVLVPNKRAPERETIAVVLTEEAQKKAKLPFRVLVIPVKEWGPAA